MIMHNISFVEVGDQLVGTLTYFLDGQAHSLTSDHPEFNRICDALKNGEDPTDILNPRRLIVKLDDRVAIQQEQLLFDGVPIHDGVANTILRYHREGRETNNIVKFLERLQNNPSERSREMLFDWAETRNLTIDDDGFIIGYRGVSRELTSIHAGPAVVNGKPFHGNVPNDVGNVISMEREDVNDNPNEGCSHGLHVGTYDYARDWGSVVILVKVDPADVVSVPRDSGFAKMRCCRYEVLEVYEGDLHKVRERYEPTQTKEDAVPEIEEIFEGQLDETWMTKVKNLFRRN